MLSVDNMLISILSVSVKTLEMSCTEAAESLAPWVWELKPDNLLCPLHLMCDLRNPNLSFIHLLQGGPRLHLCHFVITFLCNSNQVLHTLTDSLIIC